MKIDEVRKRAFAMPLTSPAFPPGPYRFINREYLIITYRTDPAALESVVPEPLTWDEPLVKYEFIRMPDSTGFGDYTESGQVIPVRFNGQEGGYSHAMFLNDGPPIYGGRELWGFPKKYAQPSLGVERDTLIGTLNYGSVRIATGTMGFKHKAHRLCRQSPRIPFGRPREEGQSCRRASRPNQAEHHRQGYLVGEWQSEWRSQRA
jgi:acetoacetate decarboxylase